MISFRPAKCQAPAVCKTAWISQDDYFEFLREASQCRRCRAGQVISIPGVDSSPSDASPQPAAPARAARVAAHYSIKLNFVARNINAVLRIQNF